MVTRRMFFGVIAALALPLQPAKKWAYVKLRFNSVYGKLTGYSAYGKKVPIRYYDVSSAYPYEMSDKRYYGAGSDAMRILKALCAKGEHSSAWRAGVRPCWVCGKALHGRPSV